jgi:hypothetical protein
MINQLTIKYSLYPLKIVFYFLLNNNFVFFGMYPAVGGTGCARIGFKNAGMD